MAFPIRGSYIIWWFVDVLSWKNATEHKVSISFHDHLKCLISWLRYHRLSLSNWCDSTCQMILKQNIISSFWEQYPTHTMNLPDRLDRLQSGVSNSTLRFLRDPCSSLKLLRIVTGGMSATPRLCRREGRVLSEMHLLPHNSDIVTTLAVTRKCYYDL